MYVCACLITRRVVSIWNGEYNDAFLKTYNQNPKRDVERNETFLPFRIWIPLSLVCPPQLQKPERKTKKARETSKRANAHSSSRRRTKRNMHASLCRCFAIFFVIFEKGTLLHKTKRPTISYLVRISQSPHSAPLFLAPSKFCTPCARRPSSSRSFVCEPVVLTRANGGEKGDAIRGGIKQRGNLNSPKRREKERKINTRGQKTKKEKKRAQNNVATTNAPPASSSPSTAPSFAPISSRSSSMP